MGIRIAPPLAPTGGFAGEAEWEGIWQVAGTVQAALPVPWPSSAPRPSCPCFFYSSLGRLNGKPTRVAAPKLSSWPVNVAGPSPWNKCHTLWVCILSLPALRTPRPDGCRLCLDSLLAGGPCCLHIQPSFVHYSMAQEALDRKHVPLINYWESVSWEILSNHLLLPGCVFVCGR